MTINGGRIESMDGCGLLMRAGSVTINNGEIIAHKGTRSPNRVMDDSFVMLSSAVIFHENANYPANTGMELTINDGTFTGDDRALEILSDAVNPNVQVLGGTFTPPLE